MRQNLTAVTVERVSPPASGRLDIFDEKQRGLVLRVTSNGAKSYVVRGRIKGEPQPIWVMLGNTAALSLAQARDKASDTLRVMRAGKDPRHEERAKIELATRERAQSFEAVAEEFIAKHCGKLPSGNLMAKNIRRYLVGAWRQRPIASITVDDVAEVIRGFTDNERFALARLTLAHAKKLFRWAGAPGRSYVKTNPCLTVTAKDFDIVLKARQVVLPPDLLAVLWKATDSLPEAFGAYYRMLLLSGQRRMEVARMTWDELDLDGERAWVVPAARMKAGRSHEVPLAAAMIRLLRGLKEKRGNGPFVFSSTGGKSPISGFSKSKRALDKAIARLHDAEQQFPAWRIHDLRRTVRTGLGAIPSIPHDIRELVIAHVPPVLAQTYDLHSYRDEKRQALELWNARLLRIVEPQAAKIVRLAS